ncbi:hypothetical protein [Flavobacterium poyangense]|uniref:hypothetical protein n=1 Tax=Flavobacterium poyangense TaxID=2204302 RepID=UPI001423BB50|nr:hypothetical protein [Flavobacterium sp. JXAS1]
MQSENHKVKSIYNFILKNESVDSDYWSLGGGSNGIQNILNTFLDEDWNDFKIEIIKWNSDYVDTVIQSIAFGFDGMFTPSLDKKSISNAGNFLLDIFISLSDINHKFDISYFSFFINKSNSNQIEKLKFMKNWMIDNGFTKENWLKSKVNPIENIEEAINKASR